MLLDVEAVHSARRFSVTVHRSTGPNMDVLPACKLVSNSVGRFL